MDLLIHALELLLSHNPIARDDGRRIISTNRPKLLATATAITLAVDAVVEAQRALTRAAHASPLEQHIARRLVGDARVRAEQARLMLRAALADFGQEVNASLPSVEAPR